MEFLNAFLVDYLTCVVGNIFVRVLVVAVCADMILGSLRAIKYHKWNSAVGIDGAIRKGGMVATVMLFTLMDMMLPANVLGFIPQEAQKTLAAWGVVKLGVTELFALLYILYEATSILKNMLLCGLPVPAGIRERLANWLTVMTDETNVDIVAETVPKQTKEEKVKAMDGMDEEELLKLAGFLGVETEGRAVEEMKDDIARNVWAITEE